MAFAPWPMSKTALAASCRNGNTFAPYFLAFDLLWQGREDLRHLLLIDRKRRLRAVAPTQP